MQERLLSFIKDLKSDRNIKSFDEAATKQTIILQCLHILGWNTFSIDEVYPEFSVGKGRVDYSLRLGSANKLFLEAKKVSEDLEKHQEQLLNYSFQQGVKLAILTNGVTWWFYLPLHEGDWEQRKFYSIDIYQQEAEDVASKFMDFLSRENVVSEAALSNAETVYKSQQRQKVLLEALPKAWNMIISGPDSLLMDLINETSESICGYRADDDTVKRFLSRHKRQLILPAGISEITPVPKTTSPGVVDEKPDVVVPDKKTDDSKPWVTDGKTWHLVKRLKSKSAEHPSDTAKRLLMISGIATTALPDVTGPYWGQKYYVSFKIGNYNWLWIDTHPKTLDLFVSCDVNQFQLDGLSSGLGVEIFKSDATFAEKFKFPSTIQKRKNDILLKIKSDFDVENEEFRIFLEGAYRSFMDSKYKDESGEYTLDGKFSGQYVHLRPVFDSIESKVMEFGDDVKLNVKKVHTSFIRKYAFIVIYVTKDKLDIGIVLDQAVQDDRLKDATYWGWSRINIGISVSKIEDIDDQLIGWMKQSYDKS